MDFRYSLLKRTMLVLLLFGMVSCTSKHQTNYQLPSRIWQGAALGGIAGIAIGAATHGSVPLVLAGGAAAGGILGYLADTDTALMFRLANAGVQVIEKGDTVTLVLPSDHFFDIHSARIKPASRAILRDIARLVKNAQESQITIAAYTDNVGAPRFKRQLSQAQAEKISAFFWAHGIDFRRLHAVGHGEDHPIATNRTVFGSGMNRRVEIRLLREADRVVAMVTK